MLIEQQSGVMNGAQDASMQQQHYPSGGSTFRGSSKQVATHTAATQRFKIAFSEIISSWLWVMPIARLSGALGKFRVLQCLWRQVLVS